MPDRQSITAHAKSIFITFLADVSPTEWDWKPIAVRAFEAAEVFDAVSEGHGHAAQESAAGTQTQVEYPTPPKPQHDPWQQQKWPPGT